MTSINILDSFIPVSRFNKGEAGRIFLQLHTQKIQIVVKNNMPIAVMLSPEEYTRLVEEKEDSILLAEATNRVAHSRKNDYIPESNFITSIGLTEEDIANAEDVEIE